MFFCFGLPQKTARFVFNKKRTTISSKRTSTAGALGRLTRTGWQAPLRGGWGRCGARRKPAANRAGLDRLGQLYFFKLGWAEPSPARFAAPPAVGAALFNKRPCEEKALVASSLSAPHNLFPLLSLVGKRLLPLFPHSGAPRSTSHAGVRSVQEARVAGDG